MAVDRCYESFEFEFLTTAVSQRCQLTDITVVRVLHTPLNTSLPIPPTMSTPAQASEATSGDNQPVSLSAPRPTGSKTSRFSPHGPPSQQGPAENWWYMIALIQGFWRSGDANFTAAVAECTHEPLGYGTIWWNCLCLEWTYRHYEIPHYGRLEDDDMPDEVRQCNHQPCGRANLTLPEFCYCEQWRSSRSWRVVAKIDPKTVQFRDRRRGRDGQQRGDGGPSTRRGLWG